jgi:hypothetical protein
MSFYKYNIYLNDPSEKKNNSLKWSPPPKKKEKTKLQGILSQTVLLGTRMQPWPWNFRG